MRCPKCRAKIDNGVKSCKQCGVKIDKNKADLSSREVNVKKQGDNEKIESINQKSSISVKIVFVMATLFLVSAVHLHNRVLILISLLQLSIITLVMMIDMGKIDNKLKNYKLILLFTTAILAVLYSVMYPTEKSNETSSTNSNSIDENKTNSIVTKIKNSIDKVQKDDTNITKK